MGDAADDAVEYYIERTFGPKRRKGRKMRTSQDYVKCAVEFKHRTADVILIAYDNEEIWVSRKLLSYSCDKLVDELKRGDEFDIQLREWKASEIGLRY